MWDGKKLIGTIILGISIVTLGGGIPCWVIGSNQPEYYTSKILLSIPIYPSTSDDMSYWRISVQNESSETHSSSNFIFNLGAFFLDYYASDMSFIFLHNLYGIDANVELYDHENTLICTYENKFNEIIGSGNQTMNYSTMAHYPQELNQNNYYRVYCPYETLITNKKGISEGCKRTCGSFMKINDLMTDTLICNADLSDAVSPLRLQINNLNIVIKDFVHTPQLYLVVWKKTDSSTMSLLGATVTGVGMVIFVSSLIIYFSMLFDQQG